MIDQFGAWAEHVAMIPVYSFAEGVIGCTPWFLISAAVLALIGLLQHGWKSHAVDLIMAAALLYAGAWLSAYPAEEFADARAVMPWANPWTASALGAGIAAGTIVGAVAELVMSAGRRPARAELAAG